MPKTAENRKFPVVVRRGSVYTKVYRVIRGNGRIVYFASWNVGGQRQLRQFASFRDAHLEAGLQAEKLAAGRVGAADLSADDAATFSRANEILAGAPLLSALTEWRRARDLTKGNVIPAAEAWSARNTAKTARKKVAEVVREFCAIKTKSGYKVAEQHASEFKRIVEVFGETPITDVSARKLDEWLGGWAHPTTRNTYRRRINAVWNWAQGRGYLPSEATPEASKTQRARETAAVIGIINSETFRRMLQLVAAKSPDLLATAVLGGFAGLRRSELITQDWSDVDLSKKVLRVTGAKAGTPSRRLVPICDAAVAWLLLCAERKGKIGGATLTPAPDRLRKLCRDQEGEGKIDLPENAARHSYISHRVAVLGNVSEVALEAGNSPQIIHRHYRELVTKAEGAAWFAVEPGKEAEVIGMDGKRVAS